MVTVLLLLCSIKTSPSDCSAATAISFAAGAAVNCMAAPQAALAEDQSRELTPKMGVSYLKYVCERTRK